MEDKRKLGDLTLAMGEGLAGTVWENGLACISNDAQNDPRFCGSADLLTSRKTVSLMAAPLIVDGKVIGVIETVNKRKGEFSSFDLKMLQFISIQSAIAIKNADLYFMATRDGLTRVYTYKYFMEKLDEEWGKSFQYSRPFSLVMLDIDDFKKVNDTYGHPTGDLVLIKIARTIEKECGNKDYVCRYGGEEFAIILPSCARTDAIEKAERMRKSISKLEFKLDRRRLSPTISGGVVTVPELRPADFREMIKMVDTALYNSKEKGKNRITFYQS
jgi:diguanylate cyclase (GGDEF)-like protein